MGISKRILTGILALIMAFSVIGCNSDEKKSDNDSNKEKKSVSTSTDTFTNPVTKATKVKSSNSEISTTKINPRPAEISIDKNLLMDSLPKTKLNNKVLKYYCYSDISPKLNLENSMASDIFSLKYGGEIVEERVDYSSYFDELAIKTLSGDSPDFLNAYNMDIFPIGVINELIQPIDDYIDLKSDIWSDTSEFADYFSVNGNHYAAVVDVLPQYVCVYNTNTIKLNGLEDPAELFKTGKWTFEKFSEMCINFTEPSKDKYGLDGYWYGSAISPTSGVPMISNKNGNLSLNLNNPFLEEVQNSIYDLVRKNVAFPKIDNNWLVRNNTYGSGIDEGLTLFYPIGLWAIQDEISATEPFGNIKKGEIMFVPMPSYKGKYHAATTIDGYVLCKEANNPEGFGLFMTCKKALQNDRDYLKYEGECLKENFGWTNEMINMLTDTKKLAYKFPVFEFSSGTDSDLNTLLTVDIGYTPTQVNGETRQTWSKVLADYYLEASDLFEALSLNLTQN